MTSKRLVSLLSATLAGLTACADEASCNLLSNGSFEFWTHYGPEYLSNNVSRLWDADPLIPVRWSCGIGRPGTITRSGVRHGGQYGLAVSAPKGTEARLSLHWLEALPGATYSYGVWAKGTGTVAVQVHGAVLEGHQEVAATNGAVAADWTRIGGTFQVGPHIRRVGLTVQVSGESDVVLDDAYIAADLNRSYDADAVLRDKYGQDEHTLLLEDFDGAKSSAVLSNARCRLTDEKGGRFGRGLRFDPPSHASIPLALSKMPEEGTIEFWVAPDNTTKMAYLELAPLLNVGGAGWAMWCNVIDAPGTGLKTSGDIALVRSRPGQWFHVAFTWDTWNLRMYLDGVLVDIQPRKTPEWKTVPTYIRLSHALEWLCLNGAIDEIRLSDMRRYGPVVPKGATFAPPPTPVPVAAPAAVQASAAPKLTDSDRAEERRKMLGTLAPTRSGVFEETPSPEGDCIYEATSAKPLVNDGQFVMETNSPANGLVAARVGQVVGLLPDEPTNAGLYWRLRNIKPGPYWLGVLYETSEGEAEANAAVYVAMYLNGHIVQMGTLSDPVQVAPGVWFAEAGAGSAVALEAGDEIAVAPYHRNRRFVRLLLHPRAPAVTAWRQPLNVGGHQWNPYTALAINVNAFFQDTLGRSLPRNSDNAILQNAAEIGSVVDSNGLATAVFVLANPLPLPVTVDFEGAVRSYFLDPAGQDKARLTLAPHTRVTRTVRFRWTEGEPAYSALANIAAVNPPDLAADRRHGGLGWPRQETLTFFPGHRQVLPWPDPFYYRVVRRVELAKPYGGPRQALSLDGTWDRAYTTDLNPPMPPPASLCFTNARVPFSYFALNLDEIVPRPHGAYMRRQFELATDVSAHAYRLVIDEVNAEGTAYVNGQKVGNMRGAETPLVCDITRAVRPGANEVLVVLRDPIAVMDPAYVNRNAPVRNVQYLDAPALYDSFALGSVSVESTPRVAADDVLVLPSVRKQTLGARIVAANRGTTATRVRVKAHVLDAGTPVLSLGEQELTLAPHVPAEVTLVTKWPNPRLWCPADPHLYVLAVELTDAATGQRLDLCRERFGFRESWIVGPDIMFNGAPVKPLGAGPIQRLSRDGHPLFARGSQGFDYCDEAGLPAYETISALRNNSSQHNVERDVFWQAAESNNLASLRRKQNHASILAWDLSNEWLCFLDYSASDPMAGARRFKHLSDVVRSYDPTRWTLANAEGDLLGLLDNCSYHYMTPCFDTSGFGMNGHTPYFPDQEFWRPLNRPFKDGEEIPLSPHHFRTILKPGAKPIMDNEFLWKCGNVLMPPGPTSVVGDEDVLSPAVDSYSGPIAWMWKTKMDGHRDLGVATINTYNHPGVTRGAYLARTFIIPENPRRAFGGRTETRRFTLVNSLFRPSRFVLRWELVGSDGKPVAGGKDARRMKTGDVQRGEFAFQTPAVRMRTVFILRATLVCDGEFACGEEWDLEVWPDAPVQVGALARKVLLFEPQRFQASNIQHRTSNVERGVAQEPTAKTLTTAGIPFERISDFSSLASLRFPLATLILAEDALTTNNVGGTAALAAFVNAGGRVVVWRQTVSPVNLPVATKLEPRWWASQVFARMPLHPILAGLTSYDLHFWQPDRAVALGAYTKPSSGSFVTLADSGSSDGMDRANLLEIYEGQGSYLLCQLPVIARYDSEPMARELFARIMRYTGGTNLYCRPTERLQVLAEADGAVDRRLTGMGVAYERLPAEAALEPSRPVLIEAATAARAPAAAQAGWVKALREGSTVVVVGAGPADAAWLTALAGVPVRLHVPPYRVWDSRGYRDGYSRYTAGLSHLDVYWKRFDGDERASGQAEDPRNALEPLQDYAVDIEGGKALIWPGALLERGIGSGTLLIDQRRWTTTHAQLANLAERNLSALLTGLNVAIAPVIPPRALPKEIAYRPIDLDPFANRGFFDEVTDDGKGGWSDQGPRASVKGFPTGKRDFLGVPFLIGAEPKSCVVLATGGRSGAEAMPKAVTIPFGQAVEGLYFLHSAAYAGSGAEVAVYRIRYADGTVFEIPLKAGENIHDWASPQPFYKEKLTKSEIAWTGSCEVFPLIGVYRMLWVNHRPDVPVTSVEFANPAGKTVPILIGLTAVLKKEAEPTNAADAAQARALLEQGRTAAGKGSLDDAQRQVKEAIGLDPAQQNAYRLLADVCERKGDEDGLLDAYGLWIRSGPRSPLPWNRTGEILEKRRNLQGALEAYKKSLAIEWNQPPIMDAVKRLESSVK